MKAWQTLVAVLVLALATAVPSGVANAKKPAPPLDVDVAKKAALADAGQAAILRVTTRCPAGAEVLEAFVYVNQDGNSTDFAGLPVICDGQPHTSTVTATARDFLLHRGKASASSYVLLTSGESISPVHRLKLK